MGGVQMYGAGDALELYPQVDQPVQIVTLDAGA